MRSATVNTSRTACCHNSFHVCWFGLKTLELEDWLGASEHREL